MVINQGDVFWIDIGEPDGSEPGFRRPYLIVQNNVFNRSRLNTVVVCSLTSSLRHAQAPGNVVLQEGEASLPKRSVANITQIFTVDKSRLVERIGSISSAQLTRVLAGIQLLLTPQDIRE